MTAVWLHEVEAEVLRRVSAAERVFCFLDYDGTLAPLAQTPDEGAPLPGTVELLRQLAAAPGMRVALLTGRAIADLRRFVDIPDLYYVGIHGLEVRQPNEAVELSEGVAMVRAVLPAVKRQLQQALGARPGLLIEDKGLALACHYRLASSADAAAARHAATSVGQAYQRRGVQIAVRQGRDVVEIRPAYVSKAKTACELLAPPARPALPIYIGDDQSDEAAFALLPPAAITIRVGPATATAARYRIEEPSAVQRFLRAVLEHRRCRAA